MSRHRRRTHHGPGPRDDQNPAAKTCGPRTRPYQRQNHRGVCPRLMDRLDRPALILLRRQKPMRATPSWDGPHRKNVRRRPTLPRSHPRSTIGASGLSFRVRNGTGRFPCAMAAETLLRCEPFPTASREPHSERETASLVCSQVLGLLVPVSSTCYHVSTSGLSTQSSTGGLTRLPCGRPHLEAGFPLRCFQRLSFPNVANQPCSWRNNWHTRGSSVPVLSY